MNIRISGYDYLDIYIEALQKYNFEPTLYSDIEDIIYGTIEVFTLEELFEFAELIRHYLQNKDNRMVDLLMLKFEDGEFVLKIQDDEEN